MVDPAIAFVVAAGEAVVVVTLEELVANTASCGHGKGNSTLPWHEASQINHIGDIAEPDQLCGNKELSLSMWPRRDTQSRNAPHDYTPFLLDTLVGTANSNCERPSCGHAGTHSHIRAFSFYWVTT